MGKSVISASRRTDIPAFYSDWFVNRLRSGYLYVKHPFSKEQLYVSLKPERVEAIVFWSKNFSPLLSKLEAIEEVTKNLFFHFTITGNQELELNVPPYEEAVEDFIYLAKRYSSRQLIWRFDPICITNKLSFKFYEDLFIKCVKRLKGHARKCYISFVTPYKKVIKNLEKYTNHFLVELAVEEKRSYANRLAEIADLYDIKLYACCNDYLLSDRVLKGSCINGSYLSEIFDTYIENQRAPSRKECGCTKSIDIGTYNSCAHGCIYCYANTDKEKVSRLVARQKIC